MRTAAIIAAAPLALAMTLPAQADWGGVAINSDGAGWGYSAGWDSRSDASARAMSYCREFSNDPSGCKVVLTTQRCGAVVRGQKGTRSKLFVEGANSRGAAEAAAMTQCREAGASCELRRRFCADDL
jgi:hypothetical protein